MSDVLIEAAGLVRRFGAVTAVDGVSFAVARGEVVGFLGPNGAGKTTTMRMLAGFLPPSAGAARIAGLDVATHGAQARRRLGYLPEGAPTYGEMEVEGYLRFCARVRGGGDVAGAMALTQLEEVARRPIETLSKGFRRRVVVRDRLDLSAHPLRLSRAARRRRRLPAFLPSARSRDPDDTHDRPWFRHPRPDRP